MRQSKYDTHRLVIAAALATLAGCAAEMADGLPGEISREERAPAELERVAAEAALDSADEAVEGDVDDKAGDSYVDWCDHPDANIGTLCRQQGCSGSACYAREAAAISECRQEVVNVCGSATPTWYIVFKADGWWQPL